MPPQVALVALFFFGMGVAALVRPAFVVSFFGIEPHGADARSEIRAVYGGFGISLGGLLAATIQYPELASGVYITIATALLGMAFGRIVSSLIERPGRWPLVFFFVELVLAALLLSGLPGDPLLSLEMFK
ncbi:MAG: DUF4345 domain-containing protein [Planctomycetota bacterium]|nr:DUF4345 domain-containing protein [Planctomycetota bacterium]